MGKRRNENGQMRREEYEAGDDDEDVNADSFEVGFQRASEDSIRQRKIVKARSGSRPPVAIKAKAAEDTAAKNNVFKGFQGLTAAQPAVSNPFAGFSGLTSATSSDTKKNSSEPSVASSKSYQQAMEGLNKEFLAFVTGQLQRNPSASWAAAVQDYVKYAAEIATKYASTKPVAINETKRAASAPYASGTTPAPASMANPATAPSSSSFSFDSSNASAKTKDETPASSGFSFGGVAQKDDASTRPVSGGFSFGGAGSSLFAAEPVEGGEKTTPAFSFGALPKQPAAPADASTPASGGFSFGNAPAPKSIASASSVGGPSFGVSASAASTSTSASTGDADDENIGREEATVIIKADSPDDDCTFEADKVKIFEFKKDEKRWADKGVHPLQVLVSKDTKSARLLVRNEIGKVVLNSALYKGMAVRPHETKGKKTGVILALQVDNRLTQFLIKVNAARVDELIQALKVAAGSS